ncbi:pectinesterase [Ricinus communis]|uniref:Pectinesterase n=1 Tax=Ricinus communis TaxID=3988 RepID=B9SP63_RICCO|nr:pectinesterase [Ricinus communis]EEF34592.1 Pectinesterase-1 precursor, putative [Ricinus communis]|eukprot:XP_002527782.1 pectinesterase [Ricinus communis]
MDKVVLAIFYVHFLFYSLELIHGSKLITSCARTPYPEVCNYFIETNLLQTQYQTGTTFSFRDQSLLVTMNQAIKAHQMVSSMNFKSFDKKAKLAWDDCMELYEDTVDHLNRSLSSTIPIDSQTWLSAAIANQQTCQNGFIDLNLSYDDHLESMPIMLSNLSMLLSNSLAVNKVSVPHNTKQVNGRRLLIFDGFPSWVSATDRRLLQSSSGVAPKADIVVAQDGSGNYKTITEAVAAAVKQRSGSKRLVIYVKKGIYKENIEIKKSMKNLMFVGDGIDATIVTGSKNAKDGSTTFRSATFAVSGQGFIAKGMTFENTAGPQKHQAVALRSGSDFSVFYGCSFKGYQDTLYVYSQRQFYRDCDIYGTIDFIFGDAVAVLQNCNIYVRRPMNGQKNTVTAQGRKDPNENTGIVIHNSNVMATSDMRPVQGSFKTYLGRPWQKYSRTLFMKSNLDGLIDPAGWLPWSGNFALSTLYYGEYMNTGSGASTARRVNWPGYHVITKATDAGKFTVGNFLAGDSWIPGTGVPFDSGL